MASPNVGVGLPSQSYANLFAQKPSNEKEVIQQRKGVWQILHGLQNQLVHLKLVTANVSLGSKDSQRPVWNKALSDFTQYLTECKKIIHYDKTNEKSPLPAVEDLIAQYEKILKGLANLEGNLSTQNEQTLLSSLGKFKTNLETAEHTKKNALSKVQKEATRLADKIGEYANNPAPSLDALSALIMRVRKSVPDYVIKRELELSVKKDDSRIARFDELKVKWNQSLLKNDEMRAMHGRLATAITAIPMIREQTVKIIELESSVKTQADALKNASISTFIATFEDKSKVRRDLAAFLNALTSFGEEKENQVRVVALINELEKKDLQAQVKTSLENMSTEIERLKKDEECIKSLEDEDFKTQIKSQREDALNKLVQQHDQVERDWNNLCLNLNKIKTRFAIVAKIQDFTTLASKYYLDAENIREGLRFTRKEKTLREEHQNEFDEQKARFEILSALIMASENSISDDDNEDPANDFPLTRLYQSVIKSQISQERIEAMMLPATKEELESVGFVWSSPENETALLERFNAQKASLVAEMKKSNADIKEAYEVKLPQICQLAVNEMNRMGETLDIESNEFDNQFTKAYYPENWVGKVVGNAATSVANGIGAIATGALSLVWSSKPTEKTEAPAESKPARTPFVKTSSPFA